MKLQSALSLHQSPVSTSSAAASIAMAVAVVESADVAVVRPPTSGAG